MFLGVPSDAARVRLICGMIAPAAILSAGGVLNAYLKEGQVPGCPMTTQQLPVIEKASLADLQS